MRYKSGTQQEHHHNQNCDTALSPMIEKTTKLMMKNYYEEEK